MTTITMKIFVKAKTKSRKEFVEKVDDTHYIVAVRDLPEHNKANLAIIDALAEYFGIAPSHISIVSGQTSREKIVEVLGLTTE